MTRGGGFTLVEVAIAAAIAALILTGAVSSLSRFEARWRLQAGVWEVESLLNAARFGAAARGEAIRVRFAGTTASLERRPTDAESWKAFETRVLPGVWVEANAASVFLPQGTVAPLATVHVWNRAGRYRITIAITGRIRARRV
ncbi:MAG: prepilin-type N-terminal cleavage/methylation domain-containing protein [Candidatus Aminicenantes bacterium]|nr:prepilin-type N-terminal cleavage/methylation domain-containing protein [Candidatus Aminicenantes bacterium]